ncbi:hypothetical protein VPH35_081279 [Triticum aestivum]
MASLCEDLHLHFRAGPEWIMKGGQSSERFFELQIFSIGPLTGYVPQPSMSVAQDQDGMGDHGVERQELLNVSAAFTVSDSFFGPRSVMSLEGVYNPEDGRMHLVGCQGVEAPWKIMSKMRGLRSGMDSSIELEVQYPPTRMRWLFSPSAKVHLSSTRATGDPLYFNRTELLEHPSYYAREMSNRFMEQKGAVCLAMPSATIAAPSGSCATWSPTQTPCRTSPSGCSASRRSATARRWSPTPVSYSRGQGRSTATTTTGCRSGALHWDMDYFVKALALLLTLRLAHKVRRARVRARARMPLVRRSRVRARARMPLVRRSRVRARARMPLEPGRVPSDMARLHLVGLLFVLAVHWLLATYDGTSTKPPPHVAYTQQAQCQGESYTHSRPSYNMAAMAEQYMGLVADYIPEDAVAADLAAPAVEKVFDAS